MTVKDIRALAFEADFREEAVEFGGQTIVVREPNTDDANKIQERSFVIKNKRKGKDADVSVRPEVLKVWCVIFCAHTKDGERLFDETDFDRLMKLPRHGFMAAVGDAAVRAFNGFEDGEDEEGNGGTGSESSSP